MRWRVWLGNIMEIYRTASSNGVASEASKGSRQAQVTRNVVARPRGLATGVDRLQSAGVIPILFLIAGHLYKTNWGIVHGLKDILEAHKGPFTEKLERPSTKGYLYPKPTQVERSGIGSDSTKFEAHQNHKEERRLRYQVTITGRKIKRIRHLSLIRLSGSVRPVATAGKAVVEAKPIATPTIKDGIRQRKKT
ncbi:hypothetical protein AgCh_012874 [Apium graveolens]